KLLEQADVEIDPAKRAQMYDQAQKLMIGDAGEVMRSVSKNYFLIKSYVKGLDFTPQDSDYAGQMTSLFNVTVEK
ncbi:MAG: peptide ABC transporter substrate-binding protein, partial [Roseiflexaceae bacterium]